MKKEKEGVCNDGAFDSAKRDFPPWSQLGTL